MSVVSGSFRNRFRATIEGPVGRVFARTGLTPNALTLIGFGISIVGAYLAATQSWLLAGLVVAFGALFDLFDGALARATNKTSKFGAFLDSTFDRAGEAVVYIGIAAGFLSAEYTLGAAVSMAALAASMMVSYTRAKSESLGFSSGTGMANIGLAPREVRMVILVIGLVAASALGVLNPIWCVVGPCPPLLGAGAHVLAGSLALIAVLATVTTIQRILFVYRQSKSQEVND
jgi:CDP-diacylglycerol---glycerol-3-phosphate 3-phosphatidyltransferase